MPFGNAPKTNLGEFKGFGEEGGSRMFDFSDDGGDDADESFDFDAFAKELACKYYNKVLDMNANQGKGLKQ